MQLRLCLLIYLLDSKPLRYNNSGGRRLIVARFENAYALNLLVGVSETLRRWTDGANYIR